MKRERFQRLTTCLVCVFVLSMTNILPPSLAFAAERAPGAGLHITNTSPRSNLQPFLANLAQSDPSDVVRVIVQEQAGSDTASGLIAHLGGSRIRKLDLIHAVVADMQAGSLTALAQNRNITWISLDAPVHKTSANGDNIEIRDEFNQTNYSGSDGASAWMSDWQEIGEDDGALQGDVAITPFWGGALQGLRLQGSERGVARTVDLSAAASVVLNVAFRRKDMLDAAEFVAFSLSQDSGSTWHEVGRINGAATDSAIQTAHFDLSTFGGAPVLLRVLSGANQNAASKLYIDSISLQLTRNVDPGVGQQRLFLPIISNSAAADPSQTSLATGDIPETTGGVEAAAYSTSNLANTYIKVIGADQVWTKWPSYLTGKNIRVAVVDSGITEHPDLKTSTGTSRILTHVNFASAAPSPDDNYGHGTHVAGIIAGNGKQSNGKYIGVAPDAQLIDVKVTDDFGSGSTSDVVAGLQWILNNKSTYNIRVVNLSLNSSVPDSYHSSPLSAAVEILWFNGIVVVVSAGNGGSQKLYPPANDPFVITVGAADDKGTIDSNDDKLARFSAYNITEDGFAKPDLLAPGNAIVSLLSADDNNLAATHSSNKLGGSEGLYYYQMSGTSMASAEVAGVVALLLQKESSFTPDQVKYRLMNTTKSFSTEESCAAGAGYVDAYTATNSNSTSSANTGIEASKMLWSGSNPVTWNSVNWNSVNWNSVNWNSVNWNSVNWNSVNWNSVNWSTNISTSSLQGNCSDVSTYGLLGQWRFNESSGTTAADASGNEHLGTLLNGTGRTASGRLNGAILLDGKDDAVRIDSTSSLNSVSGALSISAWVYHDSAQSGWRAIMARQYGSSSSDQYYLGVGDNKYQFSLNSASVGAVGIAAGTDTLNQWVHLAGVYDGKVMTLYVNGVAKASRSVSGNIRSDSKPLFIGANANSSNANTTSEYFAGQLDDVRLYNRALSAAEITTIYEGPDDATVPLLLYNDSLVNGWEDWSWGTTRSFDNTSPVYSGNQSIAVRYTEAWASLYLRSNSGVSTTGYQGLRFRVHGGSWGTRSLQIKVNKNESQSYSIVVNAGKWTQVDVPLTLVGNPTIITDIYVQDGSGGAQSTFYIDQIELVP